jgi:hypothetical protein
LSCRNLFYGRIQAAFQEAAIPDAAAPMPTTGIFPAEAMIVAKKRFVAYSNAEHCFVPSFFFKEELRPNEHAAHKTRHFERYGQKRP